MSDGQFFSPNNTSSSPLSTFNTSWWEDYDDFLIAVEVSMIIMAIFGILGNLLIVATVLTNRNLYVNTNNVLICLISMVLLVLSIIYVPLQITIYHERRWLYGEIGCAMMASFRNFCGGMVWALLSLIAIYRYLNVVHPHLYIKSEKPKVLMPILLSLFILDVGITVPPAFGVLYTHRYFDNILECDVAEDGFVYITIPTVIMYVITSAAMIFSYVGIGWHVYKSSVRIQSHIETPGINRENIRLTLIILCIIIVHVVTTMPFTVISFSDSKETHPQLRILALVNIFLEPVLTPLIYTVMNESYRTAYKKLFKIMICRGGNEQCPVC